MMGWDYVAGMAFREPDLTVDLNLSSRVKRRERAGRSPGP